MLGYRAQAQFEQTAKGDSGRPMTESRIAFPDGPEDVRPGDEAIVDFLARATPEEPRHGEGDIVELPDGRLLAAYTRYHTGEGWDGSPAQIVARTSDDGGRSWSAPRLLVEGQDPARGNVMSVSLLHGANGDLLMAHIDQLPRMPVRGMVVRRSSDNGLSWGDPVVLEPPTPGHLSNANNACLLRLSTGRILLSAREYTDVRRPLAFLSDDDGHTWRPGEHVLDADLTPQQRTEQNINEPSVCELADGRLLVTMRSVAGGQFFGWSEDGGESWSKPVRSPLRGGCSPCALRRLPDSDAVLAIWTPGYHQRTPLATAVSVDGGHTWCNAKLLERSLYHGYCYTSCSFVGERTVLSYMHYPLIDDLRRFHSEPHYHELRFLSLPTAWFTRDSGGAAEAYVP